MRRASSGFSLLELLVVITIIGVFAGAAVLSMGVLGNDREVEREAFRLRTLLELLQEEAIMQSRDFGVLFSASGYRFYVYDYERLLWLDPIGDDFLREHELTEPINLALTLEDRDLVLDESFDEEALEEPEPQVIILSSGEMTPFEAALFRELDAGQFVLTAELDGTFEISQNGFDTL